MKQSIVKTLVVFGSFMALHPSLFPRTIATKQEATFDFKVIEDDEPDEIDQYYYYLKGTFEHEQGDHKKAGQTFKQLKELEPHMVTKRGHIHHLFEAEKFDELAKIKKKVWEYFKDDVEIQLIRAKVALHINNDTLAQDLFTKLYSKYPSNEQVVYYSIVFLLKQHQNDKAMQMVNAALENQGLAGKAFLFHFLKSKILLAQHKHQEALKHAEKSVEVFPRFSKGWLFKALIHEQMGKVDAAIAGYERFLDLAGSDDAVEKQLVNLLFTHGHFSKAANRLKKMKSDKPEFFFDLALLEWKAGKQKNALKYIDKAIAKNNDFLKAKLLKVEILLATKKKKRVLSFLKDWLVQSPHDLKGFQTLFLLKNSGIKTEHIISTLQTVVKEVDSDKQTLVLLALSDMYMQTNDYSKALKHYQAIAKRATDERLKSRLLYQIGYIHFAQNKIKSLELTIQEALKLNTVSPSMYNLYAYHLAQTGKDFDKAHEMVDKGLKANPKSQYLLDTKGYIYLQQKQYKKAATYFHRALVLSPHDKTVREHYTLAVRGGQ